MDNLKLIFRLYYSPASAMSDILDNASWLFAAGAMLVVAFAFQYAVTSRVAQDYAVTKFDQYLQSSGFDRDTASTGRLTEQQLDEARTFANADLDSQLRRRPFPIVGRNILYFVTFEGNFISPLISLLLFFVPAMLLFARLFGVAAYSETNIRNNYLPLAACAMTGWVAAHLPIAIAGIALVSFPVDGAAFLAMWFVGGLMFFLFTIFAARTVLGVGFGPATVVVIVSSVAFPLGMYVFRFVSPHLFSPFLIIMVVLYFGGFLSSEARGFGNSFRQRQNFKRFLHNSTINPRDADAHVQLGLIYLQRKQDAKALEHLETAVTIDKTEIDANYELGKLARKNGDLQTALDHFSVVVEQNDKHALSDIWREIGATYLAANMLPEALEALEKFNERRSADVEGLFYLGKTLKDQGNNVRAAEVFRDAVKTAKVVPGYHRNRAKYWSKLAQKELGSLITPHP